MSSRLLLCAALLLLAVPLGTWARDVVWYISPEGSGDITTCGRSQDNPCRDLELILNQSPLFNNGSAICYLSEGDEDGRDSTTLFFLGQSNVVSPVCLMNWTNLRIVGGVSPGNRNTITTSTLATNEVGNFEFIGCSNVSIEGLDFKTSLIGKSILYFEASSDITVSSSSFSVESLASRGLTLRNCAGDILLSNNTFYGDPQRISTDSFYSLGLYVTHGCESSNAWQPCTVTVPFSDVPYDLATWSMALTITRCVFRDISNRNTPSDNYGTVRKSAVAMRVQFSSQSVDNQVVVRESEFMRMSNSEGNNVLLNYNSGSENNTVLFEDCRFSQNRARYGGGVASYFYGGPESSSLGIENCQFEDNAADFEGGGVFAVFLSSYINNRLYLTNTRFYRNSALYGGGVFIFNNPSWFRQRGLFDPDPLPLVEAEMEGCVFTNNTATLTTTSTNEGIVNLLRVSLHISGNSNFSGNTGSSILLQVSLLRVEGEIRFFNNTAIQGGALNIRDGSRVTMTNVSEGYFLNNSAFQGGAIYADDSSTTHLATEYNHTLAQQLFGSSCSITFGNENGFRGGGMKRRRFTFDGNSAIYGGRDVHSFSLRGCLASNFVPDEIGNQFFSIRSDGTVSHQLQPMADPFITTTTGPNFLFFYGSSTKCYKTVAGVTYLLPNCSISLLNSTFYLHPQMRCGLLALTDELDTLYNIPGTGLRPSVNRLVVPWGSIVTNWMEPPTSRRAGCQEPNPSNLVLSPAPGEQFDLKIELSDQLLNYAYDTVQVAVASDSNYEVLLQFNGLQYGIGDRINFTPNRPISRIALVGAIGTKGSLDVTSTSQVKGQVVRVLIPFELSKCNEGYFPSTMIGNRTQVKELISSNYTFTQTIPEDQPLACKCFSNSNSTVKFSRLVEDLSSNCISGYTVQLSGILWAGYLPDGKSSSLSSDPPSAYPPTIPCPYPNDSVVDVPIDDNLTALVTEFYPESLSSIIGTDQLNVESYQGLVIPGGGASIRCFNMSVSDVIAHPPRGEFSIELCGQGYCRSNQRDRWVIADQRFPCAENRMGPLCGQCTPGHAVSLYSTTCRDCRDRPYHYYLSLFFTLFFGLVLVVVVIFFNIGASPIVDSLLYFIQAVYLLLSGRNDYEVFSFLAFFNPNFTFNLCITPNLDVLTKSILQYVTPAYILLLMSIVILSARCSQKISQLFGKRSVLQGLWLLFLISYINITIASLEILYCQPVGPTERNGVELRRSLVLIHDPSVQCFQGLHLFYAIIALLINILFITPFPIYALVATRISKYKPISDVYCSNYLDNRRWWIFVSLGRRLLLVYASVFVQDYVYRHFWLLLCIAFILSVSAYTWPYKSLFDNFFLIYINWMLLLTAVVTQPDLYIYSDPARGVSLFIVVTMIFIGLILLVSEIIIRITKKKTIGEFCKESLEPRFSYKLKDLTASFSFKKSDHHELEESTRSTASTFIPKQSMVDATVYREPLLDSQFFVSGEEVDKFGTWNGNKRGGVTSSSVRGPTNDGGTGYFSRKTFSQERPGDGGGRRVETTTTEISTNSRTELDPGVAQSQTFLHYNTS